MSSSASRELSQSTEGSDYEVSDHSSSQEEITKGRTTKQMRSTRNSSSLETEDTKSEDKPKQKRQHVPKAVIWRSPKGADSKKEKVTAIVGSRICKKVFVRKSDREGKEVIVDKNEVEEGEEFEDVEYRFTTRTIDKWRQAKDSRLFAYPGGPNFVVDEKQFKAALGPNINKSQWLFQEELRNCEKLIDQYEKEYEEESARLEEEHKKEKKNKRRESAKVEMENNRIREELIKEGICKRPDAPDSPSNSHDELFYSSDETFAIGNIAAQREYYSRGMTTEKRQERRRRINMREEESERLIRARKKMIFGTEAEEELFVAEPTQEYLVDRAFFLYKRREIEHGSIRTDQTDDEIRPFYEANWKTTYMRCAREEWEERKGLILNRRNTYDRAVQRGLNHEDEFGNYYRLAKAKRWYYRDYDDEEINARYKDRRERSIKNITPEGTIILHEDETIRDRTVREEREDEEERRELEEERERKVERERAARKKGPSVEQSVQHANSSRTTTSSEVFDCLNDVPPTSYDINYDLPSP